MKSTRPILSVFVVSLTPLLNPGVSQAFTETVTTGTMVSNETIESNNNSGSAQQVYGTATNTTINANGQQVIKPGGTTNGSHVNSGGTLANNGGEDNDTRVFSGGAVMLQGSKDRSAVAVSNNAVIASGSVVKIHDYAVANNWIINETSRDYIYVTSDTAMMNSTVLNGGKLWIERGIMHDTTVNSGQFTNIAGKDYDTVVNSGIYFLGGASVASSYNLTINSGAYGNLNSGTITGATINGSLIVAPNYVEPSILSSLQGSIAVNNGGKLTIIIGADTHSANYTVSGTGNIALSTNAHVPGKFAFALGDVVMDGGSMTYDKMGYSTATLSSLSGKGSFYMYTNIAGSQGDYLDVTGNASGNFNVYVADTGVSPETDSSLKLIQTGGGDARFTLANPGNVVDLGTYQYHLIASGNDSWSLTPLSIPPDEEVIPDPDNGDTSQETGGDSSTHTEPPVVDPGKPSISPSTAAVLAVATADPLIFQQELETVGARLAEKSLPARDSGIWGTVRNNRLNVSDKAGADYWMSTNAITIGGDRIEQRGAGSLTRGVFVSHSHSDMHFRGRGIGGADVSAYAGGLYAAYQHDSGYWLDGILKLNRFSHDLNARMTSGSEAKGHFSTTGIGAVLKGGRDLHGGKAVVTPYVSLTGITVNSASLALSNGMKTRIDSQKSLIAAAGVMAAYPVKIGQATVHPYAGARVEQETMKNNRVWVNGDRFTHDLSGTRGVYHVGIRSQLSSTLSMRVHAGYLQGSHIESPWNGEVAVSWMF